MTQNEIDLMKRAEGCYILGHTEHPCFTQLVGVYADAMYTVQLGSELSESAAEWPPEMHLVAGPLTVQNQRARNQNDEQVHELVQYLQHDLSVWHERALAAEAKLQQLAK